MTYQHIIWDWNGTLLDDAWLCLELINDLLAARGLPTITMEEHGEAVDFPILRYYEALGFDFSRETFEAVGSEFIAAYRGRRFDCQLTRGVREVLSGLSAAQVGQSVLSAYEHDSLCELVHHYDIASHFQSVRGLEDHYARGKIDEGRRFLEQLGIAPNHVLLVGDTIHDREVAHAMGIDCVLAYSGHNSRRRIEASGAPVLESVAALPDWLEQRNG